MIAMTLGKREADTIMKAAFPPPGGAVPRRDSRNVREAVKRLDQEVDLLLVEIAGAPFHETLQELAERMAR